MERDIFLEQMRLCGICSKIYNKGDIIINYWKNNFSSIYLEEGILKMTSDSSEGSVFNLQYIKGKLLLLSNSIFNDKVMCKYNLEVVSDTAKLYFVNSKILKHLMNNSKDLSLYIINCLQKQLTFLWSKLSDFSSNGKYGSISGQLLIWTYLFGKKNDHGDVVIDLSITLQELGNSCGISHVSSVCRMLSYLKKEGILVVENSKIKITNLEILKMNAPKIEEWFFFSENERWREINL